MVRNCTQCPLLAPGAEPDSEVCATAPCPTIPETGVHTKGFSLLVVRKMCAFIKMLSHAGDRTIEAPPESLKAHSK